MRGGGEHAPSHRARPTAAGFADPAPVRLVASLRSPVLRVGVLRLVRVYGPGRCGPSQQRRRGPPGPHRPARRARCPPRSADVPDRQSRHERAGPPPHPVSSPSLPPSLAPSPTLPLPASSTPGHEPCLRPPAGGEGRGGWGGGAGGDSKTQGPPSPPAKSNGNAPSGFPGQRWQCCQTVVIVSQRNPQSQVSAARKTSYHASRCSCGVYDSENVVFILG